MTALPAAVMLETRLAPLRARWVPAYRVAWAVLAVAAVALLAQPLLHPTATPLAILVLRLIKAAVLISVSAILLRRRAKDPVAALLALAFLTWTITSSFDFASSNALPLLLDRVRFLLFVLALLLFPDGCWQPKWTRRVAACSVAVFLIGVAESARVLSTHPFLPLAILCVLAGIGSLVARFRASANYALKQQLKWVALGLVAGVGLILCARAGSAASPLRGQIMPILWEAMFQLGIIIVALGFLVSLLRFRLFDAETVISRSAAYAALTIALVATFGGTEALIQNLGQTYLGMNIGGISGGMAAAVAAVLLNPLHGRITDWAEEHFQPDLTLLKRQMPELLERLGATESTRTLTAAVLPHFNTAVHATRSALIVEDRVTGACGIRVGEVRRWWRNAMADPNDPLFPVRLQLGAAPSGRAIWLLLGPRPDGTLCGHEDLDAVRSTFPALMNAVTSALMREALEAAVDKREKRLRAELSQIRARLSELEVASRPSA
jgi:hypothetical protein